MNENRIGQFEGNEFIKKLSLHTLYSAERINLSGYKFLSILTDGAINPEPPHETLYIVLYPSGRVIHLTNEIENISIKGEKYLLFYNYEYAAVPTEFGGGFGNLFFYVSNYPNKNKFINKKGFYYSFKQLLIPAGTDMRIHFGINRTTLAHTLAMPYLPPHFNTMRYFHSTTQPHQIAQKESLHDDNSSFAQALGASGSSTILSKRERIFFRTHAINATSICFTCELS